jgi:alpha-L-arabinofuranosidase
MLLTLGNALSCSRYQSLLHRYSDLVQIANRSNLTDSFGSGVLESGPAWLYLTPTYYSQRLYQRAAGSYPIEIQRSNSLNGYLAEPDLDATLTNDGKTLRIYAINSTPRKRSVRFHLDETVGAIQLGEKFVLKDTAEKTDSEAINTRDAPNRVVLASETLSLSGHQFEVTFNPFSVTLLELKVSTK